MRKFKLWFTPEREEQTAYAITATVILNLLIVIACMELSAPEILFILLPVTFIVTYIISGIRIKIKERKADNEEKAA